MMSKGTETEQEIVTYIFTYQMEKGIPLLSEIEVYRASNPPQHPRRSEAGSGSSDTSTLDDQAAV